MSLNSLDDRIVARAKFKKGDRVRINDEFPMSGRTRIGTVVGFGRQPHLVRVLRDGLKTVEAYHAEYVDADDPVAQ